MLAHTVCIDWVIPPRFVVKCSAPPTPPHPLNMIRNTLSLQVPMWGGGVVGEGVVVVGDSSNSVLGTILGIVSVV